MDDDDDSPPLAVPIADESPSANPPKYSQDPQKLPGIDFQSPVGVTVITGYLGAGKSTVVVLIAIPLTIPFKDMIRARVLILLRILIFSADKLCTERATREEDRRDPERVRRGDRSREGDDQRGRRRCSCWRVGGARQWMRLLHCQAQSRPGIGAARSKEREVRFPTFLLSAESFAKFKD